MAVGTYKLPICDGCKLPWLPVGWTQDSDPRNLREGAKPLRCGKCKMTGWDREFVKAEKNGNVAQTDRVPSELRAGNSQAISEVAGSTPAVSTKTRCKHRMTDCPICHPKEAA